MADFGIASTFLHSKEGVLANDPHDPGGFTVYGISKVKRPDWEGFKRCEDLEWDRRKIAEDVDLWRMAEDFRKEEYWDCWRGDLIPSQALAEELQEAGFNLGRHRVVKFAQRSLNVLNYDISGHARWDELKVDGGFGNKTFGTLMACLSQGYEDRLWSFLNALQGVRYIEVAEKNKRLERYMGGWGSRTFQRRVYR